MAIRVIRGRLPRPWEKEFLEFQQYESGKADANAAEIGRHAAEPWLEVIRTCEPSAIPAIERLLADRELVTRIRGRVIEVGAGTCLLSARLSKLPAVDEVYALDLSEKFLTSTGARMLRHFEAEEQKLTFVASDFNDIPLESASFDAAFIFAAIHHSLSPIKTLQEVGRIVKPAGTIFVLENPKSIIGIRRARLGSLALSAETTEIAYTRGELEYLIANAGIGSCEVRRWDVLSRPGPRRWIRHLVRVIGLEDVVLNPPNYLFVITTRADGTTA